MPWNKVLENRGLVWYVVHMLPAKCFQNLSPEDYYQAGLFGLLHAVETYNPEKKTKFSTHAFHWIRSKVTREYQNAGYKTFRIPSWLHAKKNQDKIKSDRNGFLDPFPIHKTFKNDQEENFSKPNRLRENLASEFMVKELFTVLTEKERQVLELRYGFRGEPMNFKEIGRIFGVSRQRIQQIEVQALEKLREKFQVTKKRNKPKGD